MNRPGRLLRITAAAAAFACVSCDKNKKSETSAPPTSPAERVKVSIENINQNFAWSSVGDNVTATDLFNQDFTRKPASKADGCSDPALGDDAEWDELIDQFAELQSSLVERKVPTDAKTKAARRWVTIEPSPESLVSFFDKESERKAQAQADFAAVKLEAGASQSSGKLWLGLIRQEYVVKLTSEAKICLNAVACKQTNPPRTIMSSLVYGNMLALRILDSEYNIEGAAGGVFNGSASFELSNTNLEIFARVIGEISGEYDVDQIIPDLRGRKLVNVVDEFGKLARRTAVIGYGVEAVVCN